MKLSQEAIGNKKIWENAGFILPCYERNAMIAKTRENPKWLHLGAGNIFRAFPCSLQQELLNAGITDTGIIVAEGFDYEIIEKMYQPKDNLSLLVTLKADGGIEKTVIGSIAESVTMDSANEVSWRRLKEIFAAPSLQMVSFTITEKGYNLWDANGVYYPQVADDLSAGPEKAKSYIGKLTALLYCRYQAGKLPVALVSMDNCSHNGTRLYQAIHDYVSVWTERKLVDENFAAYIENPSGVSFPWGMIDKITPRPDDSVKQMLKSAGFEDVEGIITGKNTYVAPFVNAEEPQYLVIEDSFPNGRPPLDQAGVIFTNRETVDKVEKMKVCTCLNPLHTALAVYGCLLGYTLIADEMKDPQLKKLVEGIGYQEGLPVVVDPEIIRPEDFIKEVLVKRIPNPFMPDTPQRIATDTSQKLGVRFGETIKAYMASDVLDIKQLKLIPLVLAGWCRYLLAVDDEGNRFTPSPDPMLKSSQKYLETIHLGDRRKFHTELEQLLSDCSIFGVDLYEAGLGEKVESYFAELTAGIGAVRKTLIKYTDY